MSAFPETADVETSSEDYARRFSGAVGEWFLALQERTTLELLAALPPGATVLDVGGGHAQLTPALTRAGYDVVVVGSDASCAQRLARWIAAGRCRFEVANVVALPFADRSFDAVLSVRLLPHVKAWQQLVGELCRVAKRSVVVDYPTSRSVNVFSGRLFVAKKRLEGNTRPFTLFRPAAIEGELERHGFSVTASRPQFLWPMVLHRMLGKPSLARALEAPGRWLGVTSLFGSPVIVRGERMELGDPPRERAAHGDRKP